MALKANCSCLENTADDEPIFVLVARDKTAPWAILDWVERAEKNDVGLGKVYEARQCAQAMFEWQNAHPDRVKTPD